MFTPRFGTAISCIDGRVQIPVIHYLKNRFALDYIDVVSEPGPNAILAEAQDLHTIEAILRKVRITLDRHGSRHIAVVGHHDCAGNPAPYEVQADQILTALHYLRSVFPEGIEFIGLWVNHRWSVAEVPQSPKAYPAFRADVDLGSRRRPTG